MFFPFRSYCLLRCVTAVLVCLISDFCAASQRDAWLRIAEMALQGRDFLVLILAVLAVLLSATRGQYPVRNGHAPEVSEKLPSPVIADVDGDGLNEIVMVTDKTEIKIVRAVAGTKTLQTLHQRVLFFQTAISYGRRIVGLSTGFLDPYDAKVSRKQVIVAVTNGWDIFCFDHELTPLWDHTVGMDLTNAYVGEVSIFVGALQLQTGDRGTVVAGGRLQEIKIDVGAHKANANEDVQ
eukprot:g53045.t1